MRVTTYADSNGFLSAAREYLEREEAAHGLILGIASSIAKYRMDGEPLMLAVHDQDKTVLAAVRTPPRPLLIAGYKVPEEALGSLTDHLLATAHFPSGLIASEPLAGRMVARWQEATGCTRTLQMHQRIYQLTEVAAVPKVAGRFRRATSQDLDTVADWWTRFTSEATTLPKASADEVRARAAKRIEAGDVYLWEDACESRHPERPVSMAMATRPTRHGISVGGVYTPREQRRKGYATACVSSLSQVLLDRGHRFCCLYTDLANPTSNRIYRKIGYHAVSDSSQIGFEYEWMPAGGHRMTAGPIRHAQSKTNG